MIPKITIGLTCYNAAQTIRAAIKSAAAQDWPNTEILIVDDCSTDHSATIIKEEIKDAPNARLIRHERNTGFAGALNTLIAQAAGEFLAIFDDDDISLPARIRRQFERIAEYERKTGSAPLACYATTRKTYPNGYEYSVPAIGSCEKMPQGEDMVRFHLYLKRPAGVFYGGGTPSCSLMARIATFRAVGGYDTSLRRHEDCDFAVRLGLLGGHFIGTRDVLVRQTSSGGGDKKPETSYESEKAFLEKHRSILEHHRRYEFARAWAAIKYHHYAGRDLAAAGCILALLARHPAAGLPHFLRTGPRRLLHELHMKKRMKTP